MADDDGRLGDSPSGRPFMTMPDRPPLRQVANPEPPRSIEARTQARRDAVIAVARARARAQLPPTIWTGAEIDTLHAITDLLLQIQSEAGKPREDQPYGA
jgi:hypothetical protein